MDLGRRCCSEGDDIKDDTKTGAFMTVSDCLSETECPFDHLYRRWWSIHIRLNRLQFRTILGSAIVVTNQKVYSFLVYVHKIVNRRVTDIQAASIVELGL
jgi:hypothetical protein